MLANFNYKGYNGDANDKNYGQAIVYRRKWIKWEKKAI
jgi:hypothetical protein